MSLDASVARAFDDSEPTRFGSGWLSGTASMFLGVLGLGAVACFHFPELLTSPDVRALLPIPIVRTIVQLTFVPLFLLGFDAGPLYAYLVFVSNHAVFIHANVSWAFPRWVEALVVTPRFHHWHHGADEAAIDKNFAVHLPWIDRLFGTYYGPAGEWPKEYGIAGNPVPDGYLAQLTYPVRRTPPRP